MKKSLTVVVAMLILGYTMSVFSQSDYYEFSQYNGTGYEYDVACYENTIYYRSSVWDGSVYINSVHSIDVSVADYTKVHEPRFLADGVTPNPNFQTRIFSNPTSVTLGSAVNNQSRSEMYVDENYIYTGYNQTIKCFDKNTGTFVSTVVTGGGMTGGPYDLTAFLSYGDGKWWSGDESRKIYSSTGGAWTYEFTFADMTGGHGDGMEFVNGKVYVSDMTSNFIARWAEVGGVWVEEERYAYNEIGGAAKVVEGMGFGALDHFWAGAGSCIYELGGGEIQHDMPEPATLSLLGFGLLGLLGFARIRRRKK